MWTRRAFVATVASSLIVRSLRSYGQLPEAPIPSTTNTAERAADSYAIYSLLLSGLENPRNNYLLAAMTRVPLDVPTLARTSQIPVKFGQRLRGELKFLRASWYRKIESHNISRYRKPWMTISEGRPLVFCLSPS